MDRSVEACRRWRDTKVRSEGGEYGPARGRKLAESDVAERAHENLPCWALRRARASTPQSICFCGEEQKKQIVAAATASKQRVTVSSQPANSTESSGSRGVLRAGPCLQNSNHGLTEAPV